MNKKQIIKETLKKLKAKGLLNEKEINKYLKEYGNNRISNYSDPAGNKYLSIIRKEVPDNKIVDQTFKIIGKKANAVLSKIADINSIDLEGGGGDDDYDYNMGHNILLK